MTALPAPPTLASPSWWGADSVRHREHDGSQSVFVKQMTPFSRAYVHVPSSFAAAVAAGERGYGPNVISAEAASGRLVLEDLTGTHKTGTLADFIDRDDIARLAAIRREVSTLDPVVVRRAVVFDEIRDVLEHAVAHNAALPGDLPWLLRVVADIEQRIEAAGFDLAFCHGDGNVSNTMIARDSGAVALLDWDACGLMDPMQDLGGILAELAPFDLEGRDLFEAYWGSFDASLHARARLYGAIDSIRWALIGAYADAVAPGTYEYSKFSDWHFFLARTRLAPGRIDELLRMV